MPRQKSEPPMTMLPAVIREGGDDDIDAHVNKKLDDFEFAMDESRNYIDPVRRFLARECLRLALDPRVDQAEVRSRSGAFSSIAKVMGLDRDIQRFDVTADTVEQALKRLREATKEGLNAAGQLLQARAGESPGEVHDGQAVLLRSSSLGDFGAESEG